MPEAGWYQDPSGKAPYRWWDGANWLVDETTDNPNFPPSFDRGNDYPMQSPDLPVEQPRQPQQFQQQNFEPNPFLGQEQVAQQSPYQNEEQSFRPQNTDQGPAPWDTAGTSASFQTQTPFSPSPSFEQPSPYQNFNEESFTPSGQPQDFGMQNAGGSPYGSSNDDLGGRSSIQNDIGVGKLPWEVDDDTEGGDEDDEAATKKKKVIMIGGGVVIVLVVLFMLFGRGGNESITPPDPAEETTSSSVEPNTNSNGSGTEFQVIDLGPWARWPSFYGYAVDYPVAPQSQRLEDRLIVTSVDGDAQYQLVERYLAVEDVASFTIEQRLALVDQVLAETQPSSVVESAEGASLGGIPARKFNLLREDGTRFTAMASFTANRLFLLLGTGEDTERFYKSFMWHQQPEFAPPAPQ